LAKCSLALSYSTLAFLVSALSNGTGNSMIGSIWTKLGFLDFSSSLGNKIA